MPYSPLYRSIHIVLFGAVSLSALSISTVSYAAPQETTLTPIGADDSGSYSTRLLSVDAPAINRTGNNKAPLTPADELTAASKTLSNRSNYRISSDQSGGTSSVNNYGYSNNGYSDEAYQKTVAAYQATLSASSNANGSGIDPISNETLTGPSSFSQDADTLDNATRDSDFATQYDTSPVDNLPPGDRLSEDNVFTDYSRDHTDIKNNSAASNNTATKPFKTSNQVNKAATAPIDLNEDSIQRSLERLAEFYELTPEAKIKQQGLTLDKALNINKQQLLTPTKDAERGSVNTIIPELIEPSSMPAGLPEKPLTTDNLDDSPININAATDAEALESTVDSNARCDGRWVYPKSDPNYQRISTGANSADSTASNEGKTDNSAMPLYAQADYGYYDNVDYAELSGNVIIDQGGQHIEADKIVMDLTRGVAAAQGQVMFTDSATSTTSGASSATSNDNTRSTKESTGFRSKTKEGGLIGVADSLAYNTTTGQSTAKDVAFASVPLQAHGYAKRLNRPTDSRYELDEVMFTTCPPSDRKWQIDAKNIDLNIDTGRGIAYDTTFKIADVPVLYLPYFNFPIDSRRSTGFLLPSASIGSESGIELDVPYYLNLAPDYDATINTHIYTNRNPMLTGEFRYLTEHYGEGRITGSYLAHDRKYDDEDRSSLFFDHNWTSESIPRLNGDILYSYVSDADYLNDFDKLGLVDNTLNLPRHARLNYYNDLINGELKVETFQSLKAFNNADNAIEDKDKPYSRLPQLSLNYRLPLSETIDITGVHDSAYFKKSINDDSEEEKSGIRLYNKLSASYPIERAWGYATPKLSLQHLYASYDQDSLADNQLTKEDGRQSVFVPQVSLDAGLHLYRTGSPFGWYDDNLGGYQLLSPRVKYTYAPYKNQNDLPNFNTSIASINYSQLYADSWFLGHDRLQDLHAITPGLNYRYIDAMGVTRFDGSIAEQFYFDEGEVTLTDQADIFTNSSSGVVWEASAQPYHHFWVDVSGAFTSDYNLNYITTELRYQPTDNSLFNVGYIKRRQDLNTNQLPLSAITASSLFPINNNWRLLAQGQYDLRRDKMLDALVGVDFEDCCFGFALYGRRYYNDLNLSDKPNQAVMAEIRLNGLGNSSSRLTRLLADKVLGFEPVQSAWKD